MKVNVISTGSSGNLYELVDKQGNCMLIEAGMSRAIYMKYRIGKTPPEMCVISHSHFDHSKFKGEFQAVIPTHFMPKKERSESWYVIGFEVNHGDTTTMCFIIKSLVEEKLLFFGTDFEFSDYNNLFLNLRHHEVENFLIECNYNDYLFHLATEEQRIGCSRHLSDNDVVNFIKRTRAKNPKIITIHGSNRLSADTYTKKYLSSKLLNATVEVATGVSGGQKNIFII